MLVSDLALGAVACVLALILVPPVAKLAGVIGAVDKPNARKVHTKVMPRLGGLAIYLSYMAVVLISQKMSMELAGLLIGSTI